MVVTVALTIQEKHKPFVNLSTCVLFRPPESGRLKCTTSGLIGIDILHMPDGTRHRYMDPEAINVWCSSGASFAMNRLGIAGFDMSIESVSGTCDDLQDVQGIAVAVSAAMFIAYDRADLLAQHLGTWEVVDQLCDGGSMRVSGDLPVE